MSNKFTDKELVDGMLNNNKAIIEYFFFEKCTAMFHRINHNIYNRQAERNELINEFYLYLKEDDWHKLRQFDYRNQLMTYISSIAFRFFCKNQIVIIEIESIDSLLYYSQSTEDGEEWIHQSIEAENLLSKLTNQKYRYVLRKLILEDVVPRKLAAKMKTTVHNLYNLKRRAIQKLVRIVGKGKNK